MAGNSRNKESSARRLKLQTACAVSGEAPRARPSRPPATGISETISIPPSMSRALADRISMWRLLDPRDETGRADDLMHARLSMCARQGAPDGIVLTAACVRRRLRRASSRAQHLQGALDWRAMARDGDAGSAEDEHARLAQVGRGCCTQ